MEYLLCGIWTPSLDASHDGLGVVNVLINCWSSSSSVWVGTFYPKVHPKKIIKKKIKTHLKHREQYICDFENWAEKSRTNRTK